MGMIDRPSSETRSWLPLSLAQRGIWLDTLLIDDPSAYQLGTLSRIAGAVDPDLARQAVRVIMGRHDALRLRVDRAEPRQWLAARSDAPFRLIDLSDAPEPEAAVKAHVRAALARGFSLGDEPLFRLDLIKVSAADWRLLMHCHHLLGDGLSIGLVQRYWLQAYAMLLGEDDDEEGGGAMAAAPLPPSSYLPVIEDDAVYMASRRYAEDMNYWRDRLTPLPALVFEDRPRPAPIPAVPEASPEPLILDPATYTRFETAARAAGATPHRALLALIGLTLSRRYGASDFAIGMALHRRDHTSAHVIGVLAGMIAVRCHIDAGWTLAQTVQRVAADIDADLRHQRTPVDELGRVLGLGGAGRKSLFDVAVTILPPVKETAATLGGVPIVGQALRAPEGSPLTVSARELPERRGMIIDFGFDPAILTAAEVDRLRDRLQGVIDAFLARPTTRNADLDGLTEAEEASIRDWSSGPAMAVPNATLPDLFEAQAARTPDTLAVVADEGALTYRELDRAANRVAVRLRALALGPNPVVGVGMARSIDSVVALLGLLKAGAVYLPLDPVYPAARRASMIADAGARVVLTKAGGAADLPPGVPTIVFDAAWPDTGEATAAPERFGSHPDEPAYVIYTSGSTGRPKGVAMAHRAVVNLAHARQIHDPIGPGDRVLAAISIGFDVSIGQLLLPLLSGATVVVAGEVRGLSPEAFWRFMTLHAVSHVNSVPSFFEGMIEGAPPGARLTRLMLGGEALSGDLAARLRHRLAGTEIVNMYGPTEACIDATAFPVPRSGMEREAVLPIGRPLPNYTLHLLDAALRPVPIGAAGEVFIGGAGLAQGYLGAPDLTAERFLDTPDRGRLYRTGDRGAWREDGTVAFLGRVDAQVKIRGFRVEPAEIEAALLTHPAISQAAVIARPDERGDLRLLAYLVTRPDARDVSAATLRGHIERGLPAHMIPSAFTIVPAFPLTPNGKLDERAFPDPPAAARQDGAVPRTAMERLLADLFGELLGVPPVDIETSFFDLGGHSLLATQLAARLRERLGIELPIRTLFEAPRIADLAPRVERMAAGARPQGDDDAPCAVRPRPPRLPLSFAQERLWFLNRLDPTSAAYNIPIVLRLEGALDVAAFEAALTALLARHESLRTRFAEVEGEATQIVLPPPAMMVEVEDLAGHGIEAAMARAAQEATRPFDLDRDPLLRARLLRLDAATHMLVLTMHHIVSDGWSAGLLVRDMAALYEAHRGGTSAALPDLALHYADYAIWQRRFLSGAELARQADYWRATLSGAPDALTLVYDAPRPSVQTFAGANHPVTLSRDRSQALATMARSEQATLFMVLIAAWAALLARWSGQDDLVIGTPIANRTRAETENLIGFFVNTLALRADLSGAPGFRDLVRRIRGRALDAYAHQDMPFEKLVDLLKPQRDLGRHPVFQVMFVLQPMQTGTLALPDLALSPVRLPESAAKFDLTLTLTETPEGLHGEINYATGLFAPATIARLADQFERLIDAVVADPEVPLGAIDLLSAAERRQVLVDWAGTRRPVRIDTIPALFEAQVAATPNAPAVIFNDIVLTYAELDARADRLARALMERGISPERPVGVALERSDLLVVAAMAVLKAGGVYLPLDPAYPAHRLADMIADAGAALVLTSRATAALLPVGIPSMDAEAGADRSPPESAPAPPSAVTLDPGHLAYIVFTSGSTGRPKGVAVTHAALANLAAARQVHDPIGPGDRVLAALSVGFDVSIGQIVTPLLSGATIVMASELGRMSGSDFWTLLRDKTVTHVNSGPSFIDAVIDLAPPGLSLRRLMLGGEPFPRALARKLRAALPATELFNMYGPSETCIDASCYRVTGEETAGVMPIGRPLPNYLIRILDPGMQPVGIGIAGEVHIGGDSLARFYVERPDLTRERFVPDPFGPKGTRLYRTGDLARWRPDGTIDFIGRTDSQVKIRGFRIELGEIEAALRAHPAVATTVVVTRSRHDEAFIAAYMVAHADMRERPAAGDLRRHLAASLPEHMIPRAFTWLEALPLTINAKVDVGALPAPVVADFDATEATEPRDDLDRGLRSIWQAALDQPIGIDDNVFERGGHSLMALKVAAACKATLKRDIPIGLMFQYQTIRALADALKDGARSTGAGPLLRLQAGRGIRPLFCFHPIGGTAFCYRALAAALGEEWPVHGLRASGLLEGEALAPSLAAMAAAYVAAIRAEQPDGPYRLLGHSFGGLVAFEAARQLVEAGQSIECLVLLDTSIPDSASDRGPTEEDVSRLLSAEGLDDPSLAKHGEADRIKVVIGHHWRLSQGYAPVSLPVPLLYVAADRRADEDDRADYWLRMSASPLSRRSLPCGHFEMVGPSAAAGLAALVIEALDLAARAPG